MDRKMLRDDQWARIEQLLPGKASDRGVTAKDNRRFVEAVLWVRGAICLPSLGIGIGHSFASRAGARKACGNASRQACPVMLTWSICSLTRRSCAPTNTRPAPKKSRRTGNRAIARRTDDQVACSSRFLWQSATRHSHSGPALRYRASHVSDQRPGCPVHRGRQGLRFGCLCPNHHGTRRSGSHSASFQPTYPSCVRSAHLQEPQFDRAFLQPHQALQTYRYTLRQTCKILPVVRSSRLRFRMADLIENTP